MRAWNAAGAIAGMCGVGLVQAAAPEWAANALLRPAKHLVTITPPQQCREVRFEGDGVALAGWSCRGAGDRRGTIVYLHGVADNRGSAAGVIDRFTDRGFDVIAYDSRAHGGSTGEACTYRFFEKRDLRRVIDTIHLTPVILIGSSLGAAVALQEAGDDDRIATIVAAEPFSDLRTVATERAPTLLPKPIVRAAFSSAEQRAHFDVDSVSPEAAARRIRIPVLLIHGAADRDTPPDHSRRIFDALAGPKRLVLVPGAAHNGSLRPDVWREVERWIDASLTRSAEQPSAMRGR